MRVFCAIELSDTCLDMMAKAADMLRAGGVRSGIVKPENMHLTLRFMGEVDTATVNTVTGLLQHVCADMEPFRLLVGGLGAFPNWKRPSAVWIGVSPPDGPLERVQASVEEACRSAGLAPETRAFKPHVTLARIKDPSVTGRVLACRDALEALGTCVFTAQGVTVFESMLTSAGSVYRPIWQGVFSG
jgi:RNA 2',3'-cyclic 3'-phosphodiesterase